MAKRNTTESVIDSMVDESDAKAQKAKAKAWESIPDPSYRSDIAFELVYSDRNANVRDASSYGKDANKELYASLKADGLRRQGDTMIFSLRGDGRYKVLVGHLRHDQMCIIRDETVKANPGMDAKLLPFATIHGLVYSGLSDEQETDILSDHVMRKGLNQFELAKEIGELMEKTKMSDAKASIRFGFNVNKIQRLRMRYCMPLVFEEFRKEKSKESGVDYIKITDVQLKHLYSAYCLDRDAGCPHRTTGSAFRNEWEKLLANPDVYGKTGKEEKPESRSVSDIKQQTESFAARYGNGEEIDLLGKALMWASGDAVNLDGAASALKELVKGLRDSVTMLTTQRDEAIASLADARKTIESLTTQCERLQKRIESAKAMANGQKKASK